MIVQSNERQLANSGGAKRLCLKVTYWINGGISGPAPAHGGHLAVTHLYQPTALLRGRGEVLTAAIAP